MTLSVQGLCSSQLLYLVSDCTPHIHGPPTPPTHTQFAPQPLFLSVFVCQGQLVLHQFSGQVLHQLDWTQRCFVFIYRSPWMSGIDGGKKTQGWEDMRARNWSRVSETKSKAKNNHSVINLCSDDSSLYNVFVLNKISPGLTIHGSQ